MFGRSFRIATVRGIPVFVDSSWIWIAALAVYTLWSRFDARFPNLGTGGALAYAAFGALLFFGSVFLHELAHGIAARAHGIRVDGITLVFFGGFTAARSEEKGPGPAFVISAAGPGTSLALGALFWGISKATEGTIGPLPGLFGTVGWVNLFMAGFNVLPGLPLDGGRMLQSAVWRITGSRKKGTRIAAWGGMAVGIALFAGAILEATQQELFAAIWLALIGMFIFQGARASIEQFGIAERLAAATVAEAMEPPPTSVPAGLSLSEALDRYLRGHEGEAFPVLDESGKVIGMVSFASARELGARDPLRPVRDALIPLDQVLVASPDEHLDDLSDRLGSGKSALVMRDGELVGAISERGLYRFAASRSR
jgi:Zn-dependent protease